MKEQTPGRRQKVLLVCWLVLFCLLPGCAAQRPYLQEFSVKAFTPACSVALLPFANKSGFTAGGQIFYRIFMTELIRYGNWRIALEGDVRKIYRQLRLRPWEQPSPEQLRIIASRLGVERLIGAEILAMDEQVGKEFVNPSISVQVRVYDGQDGRLLFATIHRREGAEYRTMMHFGLINTVTSLAKHVTQEILTLWESKGFVPCHD
ncbi:hypothetical protein ACUUL3_11460 [Thiovibrio sp. JS02]